MIFPPSACPTCNHQLHAVDLIPVFSWLFLRGKCRYCQAPISHQYPLVEATMATIIGISFYRMGLSAAFVVLAGRLAIWFIASVLFLRNEVKTPDPFLWAVIYFVYLNFPLGGCPFIDRRVMAVPFIAAAIGLTASMRNPEESVFSWGCLAFIYTFSTMNKLSLLAAIPLFLCAVLALKTTVRRPARLIFFTFQLLAIGLHLALN